VAFYVADVAMQKRPTPCNTFENISVAFKERQKELEEQRISIDSGSYHSSDTEDSTQGEL
jgi:hypothetical protein